MDRYADQYTGADEDRLAGLYDAHHSRHLEDLEFWLDLAAQHGGPILELGCGTGRVLIPLAGAGHTVYGLDYSAAMLRLLKKNLAHEVKGSVHIVQADLTIFRLAKTFTLIILPCNTYSTLSEVERSRCLKKVHQHLASGGSFVASMPNPELLLKLPRQSGPELEEVFVDAESGDPVQVSSSLERRKGSVRMTWHYDQLSGEGQVQRVTLESVHQLRQAAAYLDDLLACGLTPAGIYGDFDRSAHNADSPFLIISAKR